MPFPVNPACRVHLWLISAEPPQCLSGAFGRNVSSAIDFVVSRQGCLPLWVLSTELGRGIREKAGFGGISRADRRAEWGVFGFALLVLGFWVVRPLELTIDY